MISFHQSNHRDFKNFYIGLVQRHWTEYFPTLISYSSLINTMSELIAHMCAYFQTIKGKPTGIAFVDSTSLRDATIFEFLEIKYLLRQKNVGKERWGGFSVLNFTF